MQSTYELVLTEDAGMTTVVPVGDGEISIGRQSGNTIKLAERNVSRRHARLMRTGDAVAIEDLGSYLGLRVNGHPIARHATLRAGDEVRIGDCCLALRQVAVTEPRRARALAAREAAPPVPGPQARGAAAAPDSPPAPVRQEPRPVGQTAAQAQAPGRAGRRIALTAALVTVGLLCAVVRHREAAPPVRQDRAAARAGQEAARPRLSGRPPAAPVSPGGAGAADSVTRPPRTPALAVPQRPRNGERQRPCGSGSVPTALRATDPAVLSCWLADPLPPGAGK